MTPKTTEYKSRKCFGPDLSDETAEYLKDTAAFKGKTYGFCGSIIKEFKNPCKYAQNK